MKIDTTQIDGYADMTAEQKLAALEAYEYEDHTAELEKLKNTVSKSNSEAAEYKRKLREATTNSEKAVEASNSELTAIKEQLAALQREKSISEHTASFIAQGYDKALAVESATALMDGDSAKLFANMGKFLAERDKTAKAKSLADMERPSAGVGTGATVPTDYAKLIGDAMAKGDYGLAAHYQSEQFNANNGNN